MSDNTTSPKESKGADVNVTRKNGYSPLICAIKNSYENTTSSAIKAMVDAGADVNVVDRSGYTPLTMAVKINNHEMVKVLVDAGADVNAVDRSGYSPLMAAINNGSYPRIVETLAKAGADVNQVEMPFWRRYTNKFAKFLLGPDN